MRKYIIPILLFSLISFIFNNINVSATNSLKDKVIVIDPGHGDKDPGTSYNNILEKDINLSISIYLKKELENMGAKVIMTRNGDYDLSSPNAYYRKKSDFNNRINIINNSNASLYLSIHLNYLNDSKYYGPQVFYNKNNKALAESIQTSLNKQIKTHREAKRIPDDTYMYSKLKTPGVLIECGFLSNSYERNLLITDKYQKNLAKIITSIISKQRL